MSVNPNPKKTVENVDFQVDDSFFILHRIQDEVDSLKEITAGLQNQLNEKEGSLNGRPPAETSDQDRDQASSSGAMIAELQRGFQEETASLKAVIADLEAQLNQDTSSLKMMAVGLEHRFNEETADLKALSTTLQQRSTEEMDSLRAAMAEGPQAHLMNGLNALEAKTKNLQPNKMAMLCFSGDLDRVLASFILATGAAAMGMEVMMFFSFWGCTALRKKKAKVKGKDIFGKMFGFMLPKGPDKIKLSNMHMGGMGTGMMKWLMKKKNVDSLPDMMKSAEELGIKIYVCEMSMEIMGMKRGEIIDYKGLQFAGAGKFLQEAAGTEINLFL